MRNRMEHIDTIRGISMFVMILIHTNAYFLSNAVAKFLWDSSQFAVPVFVFCSSYLFYKKEEHSQAAHTFAYYRKRIARLLKPYYVFLAAFFMLRLVFESRSVTPKLVIDSLLLIGGVDLNWMVILFLMISAAMPLLMYLYKRYRVVYYLYALAAAASATLFLFFKPAFNYRLVMIFPWSLIILISWYIARIESSRKSLIQLGVLGSLIYGASRIILAVSGASILHYDNKYPPNLFHISYGAVWIVALLLTSGYWGRFSSVKRFIHYLSTYSYPLFFIHFFLIFFFSYTIPYKTFGWIPFFILVLTSSIGAHEVLRRNSYLFSALKSGPTI